MKNNNSLQEISEKLINSKKVAIFCHSRPDGDALGSSLALCLALKNAGKQAYVICEEPAPERLCIFPAIKTVETSFPFAKEEFDTFVSLDCADSARMGLYETAYLKFKGVTLNIDHHISNTFYGKYNYVFNCTATCELLPEVLQACNFEINEEISNLLAMGLLTDSGNFAHSDVSAKTFQIASLLREKGADTSYIAYEMFKKQTKARAALYSRVISKMRFALDDKLAFLTITQKDFEETGTEKSHTEGFVDFPLTIDCVEVSIALMEVKKGQYKASLRGKTVNVNAVAANFGGGGHVLASGCMLFGEYEEVIDKLTYAVYQQL